MAATTNRKSQIRVAQGGVIDPDMLHTKIGRVSPSVAAVL
jgi:hypothetical protein